MLGWKRAVGWERAVNHGTRCWELAPSDGRNDKAEGMLAGVGGGGCQWLVKPVEGAAALVVVLVVKMGPVGCWDVVGESVEGCAVGRGGGQTGTVLGGRRDRRMERVGNGMESAAVRVMCYQQRTEGDRRTARAGGG